MRLRFLLLLAFLSFFAPPRQSSAATEEQARQIPWTNSGISSLEALFPDLSSVDQFVNEISPQVIASDPPLQVGEYKFANLNPTEGNDLSLLCVLSDGGRFFPTILVISNVSGVFAYDSIYNGGGMDIPDLDQVVVKLDASGHVGLLIPRRLSQYDGARPISLAYDIYTLDNTKLSLSDSYFPIFYRENILPALNNELASVANKTTAGDADAELQRREEIKAVQSSIKYIERYVAQ